MTVSRLNCLLAVVTHQGTTADAPLDLASLMRNLVEENSQINIESDLELDDRGRPFCKLSFESDGSDGQEDFDAFRQLLCKVNDDRWLIWKIVSPQDADNATNVVGAI